MSHISQQQYCRELYAFALNNFDPLFIIDAHDRVIRYCEISRVLHPSWKGWEFVDGIVSHGGNVHHFIYSQPLTAEVVDILFNHEPLRALIRKRLIGA